MQVEAWINYPGDNCSVCGNQMLTPVVDVGFGLDRGQPIGPSKCEVCWNVSKDCRAKTCSGEQCGSWYYCLGMSLER